MVSLGPSSYGCNCLPPSLILLFYKLKIGPKIVSTLKINVKNIVLFVNLLSLPWYKNLWYNFFLAHAGAWLLGWFSKTTGTSLNDGAHSANTQIIMVKLEQNPDYSACPHVVIWCSRPVAKSAYCLMVSWLFKLFSLFHVICEFDRFLHLIEDEPIFFIQDLKHLCKGNLKITAEYKQYPSFLIPVKSFKTIIISYNY